MTIKVKSIIATSVLLSSQAGSASAESVLLRDLEQLGIDSAQVKAAFKEQVGINLDINDSMKVSFENEGQSIRFETLDHLSVLVPIMHARGVFNKDRE